MKTHPAIRTLDFAAGALVHGLLLLWTAPLLGWLAWFGLTLAAGAVCAQHDRLRTLFGRRAARALLIAYAIPVGMHAGLSWAFVAFHNPAAWVGIGLLALWTAALLVYQLDPLLGVAAAATLSVAVFLAGEARLAPVSAATTICAAGLAVLLLAAYADRLRAVGRPFFALFLALGVTMGANDIFYRGADLRIAEQPPGAGVWPILVWADRAQALKASIGLDLRFAQIDAFGRIALGSDLGLHVIAAEERVEPAIGPAADNLTAYIPKGRTYIATRDGRLSLLERPELQVVKQQPLPHGALVTRWAPEGVYALDEWRWVGLYDPATLELLKHWDVGPVSDLLPDETGGFFLTTLSGRLEHHRADGTTQTAPLHRLGLFHLMALDAAGGRLFVGNMAATRLQVFDARTLAMQREVEVGRGARSLLWRGAFGTLLVGEYFSGWLVAYDSDLKEIGRVYAGRRLRSIQPLRSDSVLTASAAGALAINLPTVFPGLEMRQPPDDAAAPGDPPPSAPPAAACSAP